MNWLIKLSARKVRRKHYIWPKHCFSVSIAWRLIQGQCLSMEYIFHNIYRTQQSCVYVPRLIASFLLQIYLFLKLCLISHYVLYTWEMRLPGRKIDVLRKFLWCDFAGVKSSQEILIFLWARLPIHTGRTF